MRKKLKIFQAISICDRYFYNFIIKKDQIIVVMLSK